MSLGPVSIPQPPKPPENVERSDVDWHYKTEEPEPKPDHAFAISLTIILGMVMIILAFPVITLRKVNRENTMVEAPPDKPDRYIVEVQKVTNCFRITTIHDTKTKKTFVSMDDGVHLTQVEP